MATFFVLLLLAPPCHIRASTANAEGTKDATHFNVYVPTDNSPRKCLTKTMAPTNQERRAVLRACYT